MMSGDDKQAITICAAEQHPWTKDILAYLETQGHHLRRIAVVDTQHIMPNGTVPDAIVTLTAKDSISLAAMLKDHPTIQPTPLRVLITAIPPQEPPTDATDIILPANAQVIDQMLKQLIDLHRQNSQLKAEATSLQTQCDDLQSQVNQQQKANHSVEVLKTAIVRNVSHELKTPLLQVKSAVALLAEDVDNEELINYAKNATARLETLVKNITMLGSSLDTNLNAVIVRDAVEYARRNLRRIWTQKDSPERIQLKLQDSLPPVMADKQGLSTVLQLLLDNALKFSDKDVEVIAKLQDDGDNIYIAVKDYGIGIEPEDKEKIFDTFFQVDSSSTRRYGGTGVGLAIVKLILDSHQATIHVESEVSQGSTFWFQLPAVEF